MLNDPNQQCKPGKDTSKWGKEVKIGSGTYGDVYRGNNKETSEIIAIKKIKTPIIDDGIPIETLREIVILRNINHPNVVKLYDVVLTKDKMYLIFEYMEQDLKSFIDSFNENEPIPMNVIKNILKQILSGISHVHLEGILHRDLKPQNILINYSGSGNYLEENKIIVKIADFGLARTYTALSKHFTKNTVTPLYRPPEVFLGITDYSSSVDVWSIGCIFAELLNKKPLFKGNQEMDVINKIMQLYGVNTNDLKNSCLLNKDIKAKLIIMFPGLNKQGIDLISKMLIFEPELRISANVALEHEFFKEQ